MDATVTELKPERDLPTGPLPCAARPSTKYAHFDGPCRCFFGGPAPQFPPSAGVRPAA